MEKTKREPLFHIVKRSDVSTVKAIIIRVVTIIAALIVSGILFAILSKRNPMEMYKAMIAGSFGTERRIWQVFYATAQLLIIALAITPAFKMKFWNIGAEGQVLVSGLACYAMMFYFGGKMPLALLWITMTVASVLAGIIWAVIPAVFKAQWNTNETLFTLMMNYIAICLVEFFDMIWKRGGLKTSLPVLEKYGLPTVENAWLLNMIVIGVITVLLYVYMRFSKQGYEISVVGESQNTARYAGINVKKVIIRTMVLSGALCGVAGLIFVGGQDFCITKDTVGGQGFTAIMVSWLAKFNPIFMVLTSFLIAFLNKSQSQLTTLGVDKSIVEIIVGIMLFFIIGCEFFINYKIVFNKKKKEAEK